MSKNKVSVKLQGGLGNYMFQIAAAYTYAKKTGKECVFTTGDAVKVHQHIDAYKNNVLRTINFQDSFNFSGFKTLSEPGFHYIEIPQINSNIYLQGYYQSEKYFKEYEDEIRNMFSMTDEIAMEMIDRVLEDYNIELLDEDTCSIHVRRGDFLKHPDHHPQQGIQYYMKAVKKMGMDKTFLVFSDDIPWCKENFPEMDNFIYIDGYKDYEDLKLMSMCDNHIICNSSFSWWAAWLNPNENKKIVAPSKWFGTALANHDTKDIYCKNWIKI